MMETGPQDYPVIARDPFWWSLGGFVAVILLVIGLLSYGLFGKRAECACEREIGRCLCRR